jgi:hypothetical protein
MTVLTKPTALVINQCDEELIINYIDNVDKIVILTTCEKEDDERTKYEAIYHKYKDSITLYSGDINFFLQMLTNRYMLYSLC